MPIYQRPSRATAFGEQLAAQREADRRLGLRETRQLLTVDRGVTANVPAPGEGQLMVEGTTLKWYAQSAWRSAGQSVFEWANMADVTSYAVTGAGDIDTFPSSSDYSQSSGSATYFDSYVDANGVGGIQVLSAGDGALHSFTWSVDFEAYDTGSSNPGYLLPPHIMVSIEYIADGDDFATDSIGFANEMLSCVWQSAEWAYNPPAGFSTVYNLHGTWLGPIPDNNGVGEPMIFAIRVLTDGAAHQYQWGNAYLTIVRLGDQAAAA